MDGVFPRPGFLKEDISSMIGGKIFTLKAGIGLIIVEAGISLNTYFVEFREEDLAKSGISSTHKMWHIYSRSLCEFEWIDIK